MLNTHQNFRYIRKKYSDSLCFASYKIACHRFLNLCCPDYNFKSNLLEQAGTFNVSQVQEWDDTPFLQIDFSGEILGHEGRIRIASMLNSGYTHAFICVELTCKDFLDNLCYSFNKEKINEFFEKNKYRKIPTKLFKCE